MALGAAQLTGLGRYLVPAAAGGLYLATHGNSSPYQQFYKYNTGTSQFELLTGEPDTTVSGVHYGGGAWDITSGGAAFGYLHETTDEVDVWTRSTDSFSLVSNTWDPLATTSPGGICWTRDGGYVVASSTTSPYMGWWSWNGSALTKLTNPASTPTSNGWAHGWNKDGDRLLIGTESSPYYYYYSRSGTSLTAATATFDVAPASNRIFGLDWSVDGTRLALLHEANGIEIYTDNGNDTFTQEYTNDPANAWRSIGLSPDGNILIATNTTSAYAWAYSGGSWGSITAPSGFSCGPRRAISWSGDGTMLALKENSGDVNIYTVSGTTFTAVTTPFDTTPTVGGGGGAMFNDSPQNF